MKNTISLSDFKLRLFVDTNVIIDYTESFNRNKARTFINFFRYNSFKDVELVTSDYVLWEFYGHYREELYIRKLVQERHYGYIAANKLCRRGDFRRINLREMRLFGNIIRGHVRQIENIISIQKLIGRELPAFSENVENLLQCSKFSYKDAIVFVSALYSQANIIITLDQTFSDEEHLKKLKQAIRRWPINPGKIIFKEPKDFRNQKSIKKEYKAWFEEYNKGKIIGNIIKYWARSKVIQVRCLKRHIIKENDYLYIVKFVDERLFRYAFKIELGDLRSPRTRRPIIKGKNVTIKLPSQFPYNNKNWDRGMVFFAE